MRAMANRLAHETSPYLLQHRDNPVDWYPWGEEALAGRASEDRPILLSVGYSACHWCHVMERESFEDPETAAYMNEHFVNVKVDREERPDVDAIYMEAVQAMSGQGGWPMTVFLDPEGVPFYGGTYFPPDESRGMPSFRMVMEAVVDAFERQARRDRASGRRRRARRLGAIGQVEPRRSRPRRPMLDEAVERLRARADRERGGFGGAPKFPPASALELLLARGETEIVELTLDAMLAGGIYDQLGGGFARYSVDAAWLVPHFEKMLYDNALLARAYLHGWQVLGHERYRRVCEETLDWVLREMRGPEGGFYSALDADSEGEEGQLLRLDPGARSARLPRATDAEAAIARATTGSARRGNFEGAQHPPPRRAAPMRARAARRSTRRGAALYEARAKRVWPGLDDKRLTSWNALMIAALAEAGAVLGARRLPRRRPRLRRVRPRTRMRDADGRLLRTYKDGRGPPQRLPRGPRLPARGAARPSTKRPSSRAGSSAARELADTMIDRFGDPERGGFFSTSDDHEELIARRKELGDHPIPSGNSRRRARPAAPRRPDRRARATSDAGRGRLRASSPRPRRQHPEAFAHLLRALDFHLSPTRRWPWSATTSSRARRASSAPRFRPHLVLAGGPEGSDAAGAAATARTQSTASRPPTSARTSPASAGHRPGGAQSRGLLDESRSSRTTRPRPRPGPRPAGARRAASRSPWWIVSSRCRARRRA